MTSCSEVKRPARHFGVLVMWLSLYEIYVTAKLIYNFTNQFSPCLWVKNDEDWKRDKKTFEESELFSTFNCYYLLIMCLCGDVCRWFQLSLKAEARGLGIHLELGLWAVRVTQKECWELKTKRKGRGNNELYLKNLRK